MMKHVVRAKRCRGGQHTLTVQGRSSFERKDQEFFCWKLCPYMFFFSPPILLYTFFTFCNCTQTVLKVNLNLEATFSINVPTSLQINPKWENKRTAKPVLVLYWPSVSVCLSFALHVSLCLFLFISLFFSSLGQIQDFSSGFWDGTKLACWMKGETPWRFFPKLSIYLRATNTSQSFRITILPQVNTKTKTSHYLQLLHMLLCPHSSVVLQLYIQPITDVDGTLDCFRFGVSSSANGLVIGATVMEGFYVVFDRTQRRLGFALSSCAGEGTYKTITKTENVSV